MAFECNFSGREGFAHPPLKISTYSVRGNGINGKPKNNEPQGRFAKFEEAARVATAVCLPKKLLAEADIVNDLSSGAAKLVGFVVVGTFLFVGVDFGCRKVSSSEFGIQRQSRLVRELLSLIGDVQEFVFRQVFVLQHNAQPSGTLCNIFALDSQLFKSADFTQNHFATIFPPTSDMRR
jgi:hypothetical protein